MKSNLLEVSSLSLSFKSGISETKILKSINFKLPVSSITAIVGESGSGKSVTSLALMGLLPPKISKINEGQIFFEGKDLLNLSKDERRTLRGKEMAMIFQEPMSCLNPSMHCGTQVVEVLKEHLKLKKTQLKLEVLDLFEKVKLPNPNRIYGAYPHELSGGQKQRVMIAMAIACQPKLLIADEPTTALDVTVQKEILALLKDIQSNTDMSILFISHDLSLVAEFADRILVMYNGEIVEQGLTRQIFNSPKHAYTKALILSKPSTQERLEVLPTISDIMSKDFKKKIISPEFRKRQHKKLYAQEPLLEVIDVEKTYVSRSGLFQKQKEFKALNGVSLRVYPGETLGLVGESGCGKSTLGNAILRLDDATSGKILYKGNSLNSLSSSQMRQLRKDIQIIFQDPIASLNPRLKVGNAIIEPMQVHNVGKNYKERKEIVYDILHNVGLDASAFDKFPHEFSGGQRQRIGIARTISLRPKLIICDESVSALDISVQAQVLNLLNRLKSKYNFTYIFISHDLSVVKFMADQLLVMNKGKIEEMDEADTLFANPKKAYTKKLIDAIPKGLK